MFSTGSGADAWKRKYPGGISHRMPLFYLLPISQFPEQEQGTLLPKAYWNIRKKGGFLQNKKEMMFPAMSNRWW